MLFKAAVKPILEALPKTRIIFKDLEKMSLFWQVTLLVPLALALPQPQGGKTAEVGIENQTPRHTFGFYHGSSQSHFITGPCFHEILHAQGQLLYAR